MKIRDVAKLAGVLTAAVSHVVNISRFVSEGTKQQVLAAIETGNYTPNAQAGKRASKQNHKYGLILLGREYKITSHLIVRESTGRVPVKKTRSVT